MDLRSSEVRLGEETLGISGKNWGKIKDTNHRGGSIVPLLVRHVEMMFHKRG